MEYSIEFIVVLINGNLSVLWDLWGLCSLGRLLELLGNLGRIRWILAILSS